MTDKYPRLMNPRHEVLQLVKPLSSYVTHDKIFPMIPNICSNVNLPRPRSEPVEIRNLRGNTHWWPFRRLVLCEGTGRAAVPVLSLVLGAGCTGTLSTSLLVWYGLFTAWLVCCGLPTAWLTCTVLLD